MSPEWKVFAVWLAGAVACAVWMRVNRWERSKAAARSVGMPDGAMLVGTAICLVSAIWPAMPIVLAMDRNNKGDSR